MKHAILAVLFLFYSFPDFAAEPCAKNVQKAKTGTPLTCDAFIVSEEQMQSFAKQTDELEIARKMSQVNEQLVKLNATEMEYYKQQSAGRAKELEKQDTRRFWTNTAYFCLGVVLTGIAAKAAIESTK